MQLGVQVTVQLYGYRKCWTANKVKG